MRQKLPSEKNVRATLDEINGISNKALQARIAKHEQALANPNIWITPFMYGVSITPDDETKWQQRMIEQRQQQLETDRYRLNIRAANHERVTAERRAWIANHNKVKKEIYKFEKRNPDLHTQAEQEDKQRTQLIQLDREYRNRLMLTEIEPHSPYRLWENTHTWLKYETFIKTRLAGHNYQVMGDYLVKQHSKGQALGRWKIDMTEQILVQDEAGNYSSKAAPGHVIQIVE